MERPVKHFVRSNWARSAPSGRQSLEQARRSISSGTSVGLVVGDTHLQHGSHAGKGVDHQGNQRAVAQTADLPRRGRRSAFESYSRGMPFAASTRRHPMFAKSRVQILADNAAHQAVKAGITGNDSGQRCVRNGRWKLKPPPIPKKKLASSRLSGSYPKWFTSTSCALHDQVK
jgi:hypothetical protein